MYVGRVEDYNWLETVEADFSRLLKLCPQILLDKCVVISCFDSGPLQATAEEIAKGWRQDDDLVIVPCVRSIEDLPWDSYDEWYVFPSDTSPKIPDVFVNDCMTLRTRESLVTEATALMGAHADIVGARYFASASEERQLRFWHQLNEVKAESYISAGDQLIFACRDLQLFDLVLKALG